VLVEVALEGVDCEGGLLLYGGPVASLYHGQSTEHIEVVFPNYVSSIEGRTPTTHPGTLQCAICTITAKHRHAQNSASRAAALAHPLPSPAITNIALL
jgi:hypothetical protein